MATHGESAGFQVVNTLFASATASLKCWAFP